MIRDVVSKFYWGRGGGEELGIERKNTDSQFSDCPQEKRKFSLLILPSTNVFKHDREGGGVYILCDCDVLENQFQREAEEKINDIRLLCFGKQKRLF